MAAGSISAEEFNSNLSAFLALSVDVGDTWYVEKCKGDVSAKFLVKKVSRPATLNTKYEDLFHKEIEIENTELEDDSSALSSQGAAGVEGGATPAQIATWEYHIVFSPSYGVPVLYFNVYWQDGRLLSLEEVWQSVPIYYQQRLQHERWSFITQQEHPLLQRPFFQLHPCHTATMMEQVVGNNTDKSNYLLTWLSSVGPVVHLTVPLSYITASCSKNKTMESSSSAVT